jgi:hypothetical protein
MEVSFDAFKKNKKAQLTIGIVAGVSLAIYAGSPFLAVYDFGGTVAQGNADKAVTYIDFPKFRESLKGEAVKVMTNNMKNDPEMQSNPFGGIALAFAGPIVSTMVDSYVTPSGVKMLLEKSKNNSEGDSVEEASAVERVDTLKKALAKTNMGYKSINTFQVTSKDNFDRKMKLVFQREGFASWKLVEIELPPDGFFSP